VSRTIDKRLWFLEAHLQAAVTQNGNGNAANIKTEEQAVVRQAALR
jgi:starvation-inducible DNA-binding protein